MKKLISLCFLVSVLGNKLTHPVVQLDDGKIQGVSEKTDTGKIFYAFREIPYAAPPIGNLRFAEPVPPKRWDGIRETTKDTKICMQRKQPHEDQTPDPRENEDCLYLNVFTPILPEVNKTELLSVYVYIHGGMMISGDPTEYDFQGFLDENIVTVTLRYRISTLGFLSTDDGVIPGNLWLKDQTMALKWINKNIQQFGGDPRKVTIGGHSSGGIAAALHVLNTKSKGLFRAAIIQSASALMVYSRTENATELAYRFGEMFDPDIYNKNTTQLLDLLRSIPADMVTRMDKIKRPDWLKPSILIYRQLWGPVFENPKFENAVISGPLYETMKNGLTNHVPILIGFTNEELIEAIFNQPAIDKNLSTVLNALPYIKPENRLSFLKEMKSIYTQTETFKENRTGFVQMNSDIMFTFPITNYAKLHSKFADVYFYQFSYKGPLNGIDHWKKNALSKVQGLGNVAHCDELPLLYYYRINPTIIPTKEDLLMRNRLLRIWTNFIKHSNPTPKPDPLLQNIIWPKVSPDDIKYIDISNQMSNKKDPRRVCDWTNRLEKYFEHSRWF